MTDCVPSDGSYALTPSRKCVLNIFLNLISAAGSLFVSRFTTKMVYSIMMSKFPNGKNTRLTFEPNDKSFDPYDVDHAIWISDGSG